MTNPYRFTVLCYIVIAANWNLGFVVGSVQGINGTNGTYYSTQIPQITTCQDLIYTHRQQCHINDSESWTCLKTKALSLNIDSCPPDRQHFSESKNRTFHMCGYSEICAFADDAFSCDASYNCTVDGYGDMNCTKDHIYFFQKTCIPSLLYCSEGVTWASKTRCIDEISHVDEFKGKCIAQYEGNLTDHSVWFYVQLSHFNNVSEQYGTLKSIYHPNWQGDESKLCPSELPPEEEGQSLPLIVSLPVTGGILLIAISYAFYEGKKKWKHRQQKSRMGVEDFMAKHLKGLVECSKSSIFDEENQAPCEKYEAMSDIESIKDMSSQPDSQDKEFPSIETVLPSNDTGKSPPYLTRNWDNPSYISKKDRKHSESTIEHYAHFPKTEIAQVEKDLTLTAQSSGLLENSSYISRPNSQETGPTYDQQHTDLGTKPEDNSVSNCDANYGTYMTKNYLLKSNE